MKKKIIKKGMVALLAITLLIISFSGCGTVVPPITGTVEITVSSGEIMLGKIMPPIFLFTYDINMDGNFMGTTNESWNLTIANVPIGWHTFEAIPNFAAPEYSGSKFQNISTGINQVNIFVPPTPVPMII